MEISSSLKKIILFGFLVYQHSVHSFSSASLKEKIFKECIEYTDQEIIENKAPKCRKAISNYLKKFNSDKIPRFDQGLYSYLSIALRAKMPEAYTVIEKEIYEGHLNEWTDKLQEDHPQLYANALKKWAFHVESTVRKIYKVDKNNTSDYKTNMDSFENAPELVSVWSPILMTRYLNLLSEKNYHLNEEDFSSINIIYAFSTPAFREIFGEQIGPIILKASDVWVKSLRKEQPWIIFRIFPLVPKNSDGNIKRELIWLSKYHQDFRIRSLASSTLMKIAN